MRFEELRLRRLTAAVLAAGMLVTAAAQAAAEPEQIRIGTAHRALFGVDFEGEEGYAVGAIGRILHTTDSGASWTDEPSGTDLSLLSVAINGGHRIAVGQTGTALHRDAQGAWIAADSGTTERLMSVDVDDRGVAVAAGSFGTLLRSDDAGASWSKVAVDWATIVEGGMEPHLYAVESLSDGVVYVTGEYGLILRSEDDGRSWTKVHGGEASLFGLQIRDDGVGYAVGQSAVVLKTVDHGKTWTSLSVPSTAILLGVHTDPSGRIVIPGMREMLVSSDDGNSWQQVSGADIARVWYSGAGAGSSGKGVVVVGQAERIIKVDPGS